jgi:SpoVK/Ycf46/Vps4 family AAA+-type ATPase
LIASYIDADLREILSKTCAESILNKFKRSKLFKLKNTGYGSIDVRIEPNISNPETPINFDNDYGYDFNEKNQKIQNLLSTRNNQLLIFNGPPGTGKSSYLRYLINKINKKFIVCESHTFGNGMGDTLTAFCSQFGPAIVVCEDAEELVVDRANNPDLPRLLNLIDGIYKENLPLSFILTWNAEQAEIDPALKRKGRLSYMHKFDLLPYELANKKARELKLDVQFKEPTSLAEIYNAADDQGYKERAKKLGFSV